MAIIQEILATLITCADIVCDNCQVSCKLEYDFEYLHLNAYWGYNSGELDGQKWIFSSL
jgi:hypothetical protein